MRHESTFSIFLPTFNLLHQWISPVTKDRERFVLEQPTKDLQELVYLISEKRCQNSFKELFTHLYPKIYHYSLQGGLDNSQSLEVCQEVMLKIWKSAKTYDSSKGDCKTWIFSIARNSRFDILRKKRRDPLAMSSHNIYCEKEEEELPPRDLPLMEELYQNNEVMLQVNNLPDDQKHAVLSIYGEGQSHAEFSRAQNIPLGTVKSRIRLAIQSLRKELDK